MLLLFLGLKNRQPSFWLEVCSKYSLRALTGQMLLVIPSRSFNVLISLTAIRCLNPFFAKNEGCGCNSSDAFSVNLQCSAFLTQVCSSLMRQPVANRSRKAVFLRELVAEVVSSESRYTKTLLKLHAGLGGGSCGLRSFIALIIEQTASFLRSTLRNLRSGFDSADL